MAQIAHFNVARLRFPPGDPRVAGFVDNVHRVNAVAERSVGFVWRHKDEGAEVNGVRFEALDPDPHLAISLSLWSSLDTFRHFVNKTVHGAFLRRRVEWFEPWDGPNYAVWTHTDTTPPTLDEGWRRLRHLGEHGPGAFVFDLGYRPDEPT